MRKGLSILLALTMIFVGMVLFVLPLRGKDEEDIPFVIGVSQANLIEPWRITMNQEIMDEADKLDHVKVIFKDAAMSTTKQINDVDQLMGYGIDLLIISPNDSGELTPIVSECYKEIPVIVLDRDIQGYDYTLYIGPDNTYIGEKAGEMVVDLLGPAGGNVVELQGLENSPPSMGRHKGFIDVIKEYRNIHVVETLNANWLRDSAEDLLFEHLKEMQQVDIIFAHNDDMALGARRALEKLNLKDTKIIGVDGLDGYNGGIYLVGGQLIQGTFTCPTGGKEAMAYAMSILEKDSGIPKKIILRSQEINKDNYKRFRETASMKKVNNDKKPVLGFIQVGSESKWRLANSNSIKSAAREEGIELKFINAEQSQEKQIEAMELFIKEGVDVIAMSPVVAVGWTEVLRKAAKSNIPVIMSDRSVVVEEKDLFTTFIGADFEEEGRRAARWLVNDAEDSNASYKVVELQGTPGADPVIGRGQGFRQIIKESNNINIVESRVGNFTKEGGKYRMEEFLQVYGKDIDYVFAHNDDMAIGAIEAIKNAGLKPGEDIKLISIDGTKEAFMAMTKGELSCSVECNPLLGPLLMKAVKDAVNGVDLPLKIITEEQVFTTDNARVYMQDREY